MLKLIVVLASKTLFAASLKDVKTDAPKT